MKAYSLDEKEVAAIGKLLVALKSDEGFGFLPTGCTPDSINVPILDVYEADLLLGRIVWEGVSEAFVYVPQVYETSE